MKTKLITLGFFVITLLLAGFWILHNRAGHENPLTSKGIKNLLQFSLTDDMGDGERALQDMFVQEKCAGCHAVPHPSQLSKSLWMSSLKHMHDLMSEKEWPSYTKNDWQRLIHYYTTNSPANIPKLKPDPDDKISPIQFHTSGLGTSRDPQVLPEIANVNVVDLDQDQHPDVLVCDFALNSVRWLRRGPEGWQESQVAEFAFPCHTEVVDVNKDGHLDIIAAGLGSKIPTEKPIGTVQLLLNDGKQNFSRTTILAGVGRTVDVQPADFDNDGDVDFVFAEFGHLKRGQLGWLEQRDDFTFDRHTIAAVNGGIHVPTIDINDDGRMDFIALISQEHEEIVAFLNRGGGEFEANTLYKAPTPLFGSSGIELVDLDKDGDADILYTNGDGFDLPGPPLFLPYHGVQWLENHGDLTFELHDLVRLYGAYRAVAGDMDDDGDLDIVVASFLNEWKVGERQSLFWLENDGTQNFIVHGISNQPTHLITADLGDLNEDGRLDIITGGMHIFPPHDRLGRVSFWRNLGASR